MVEKRMRIVSLKVCPESGVGEQFRHLEVEDDGCVGHVRLCPPRRVRAREPPKNLSKNFTMFVRLCEAYPEDERIHGRLGGYEPSTYQ
ncbi:hypothetical protein ACFX10_013054 [Malus domestica]